MHTSLPTVPGKETVYLISSAQQDFRREHEQMQIFEVPKPEHTKKNYRIIDYQHVHTALKNMNRIKRNDIQTTNHFGGYIQKQQ